MQNMQKSALHTLLMASLGCARRGLGWLGDSDGLRTRMARGLGWPSRESTSVIPAGPGRHRQSLPGRGISEQARQARRGRGDSQGDSGAEVTRSVALKFKSPAAPTRTKRHRSGELGELGDHVAEEPDTCRADEPGTEDRFRGPGPGTGAGDRYRGPVPPDQDRGARQGTGTWDASARSVGRASARVSARCPSPAPQGAAKPGAGTRTPWHNRIGLVRVPMAPGRLSHRRARAHKVPLSHLDARER